MNKKKDYKGGLSEGVTSSYHFKDYVESGHPSGYIGAYNRSANKDKIVEKALRDTGLGDGGVACWLTSGNGRHLMDDVGKTIKEFKKRVNEYTKGAFEDVTVWNHPDHTGFYSATIKLKEEIFDKKTMLMAQLTRAVNMDIEVDRAYYLVFSEFPTMKVLINLIDTTEKMDSFLKKKIKAYIKQLKS